MEPSKTDSDLEESQQIFNDFTEFLEKNRMSEVAIRRAMKKYEIKNMKVHDVTPLRARRMFEAIKNKYENGVLADNNWFENQRRIFIWTLICYLHKEGTQISQMKNKEFEFLHSIFPRKELQLIKFQSQSLIKRSSRNQAWAPAQDQILTNIIRKNLCGDGTLEWSQVSRQFFNQADQKYFRNAKQCRQRWLNHLDPNKTKGKWERDQDIVILKQVLTNGKKWSKIAHLLEDKKNEHMVKNRYKSLLHKMEKKINNKKIKQNQLIELILEQMNNESDGEGRVITKKQEKDSDSQIQEESQNQESQRNMEEKQSDRDEENRREDSVEVPKIKTKNTIFHPRIIESNKNKNKSFEMMQINDKEQGSNNDSEKNDQLDAPEKALDIGNEIEMIGDGLPENNNELYERIVQNANTPTADNRFSYMFDARSPNFILSPFQPAGGWTPTIFFMEDPQGQISPQVAYGNFSSKYMNDLSKFVGGDQSNKKND